MATKVGRNAGYQNTVDPHSGQKWNSIAAPLSPVLT
jgi:hypothetical protein